jgi:hypothetical protein
MDLKRTLASLPQDIDLRCFPPFKLSHYGTKHFESRNGFVRN